MGKLSETQREVLRLMADGWELGSTGGFEPRYWLQKGGLGKGGETKDIRSTTYLSLLGLGLIEQAAHKFPFVYYRLTEKGKSEL